MPYYVYKIGPLRILEKLGIAESFKEAKSLANEHRKKLLPNSGQSVKMTFAENELTAEDLLSQLREGEVGLIGDDY
jgi:hypothetical protein